MPDPGAVGLDFGTTNSAIAWLDADGAPVLARFDAGTGPETTFRSVLYFERDEDGASGIFAGPFAIARYLASEDRDGRLVQSLKSFLASRLFQATRISGRSWRLEALVGAVLRALREAAEADRGAPILRAVVGRPVRFVNASEAQDEVRALRRLTAALHNAGFRDVAFEYEPVGAAYHYERGLDHDELLLIADFGGGTSDFSLVHVGPGRRRGGGGRQAILASDGVPLAGDAFDGRIVRHVVAPALGRGAEFRSVFDRVLPAPTWIYAHLERWHHLSFLKSRKTQQILLDLRREALEPEKFEALWRIVEDDLGFLLFQAVQDTKLRLSNETEADFRFETDGVDIRARVSRCEFEGWIAEEVAEMAACVDRVLAAAGRRAADVDRVFLTGGTSLVPAVRRIFEERFGAERLRFGGELTSVANGLALRAQEGA